MCGTCLKTPTLYLEGVCSYRAKISTCWSVRTCGVAHSKKGQCPWHSVTRLCSWESLRTKMTCCQAKARVRTDRFMKSKRCLDIILNIIRDNNPAVLVGLAVAGVLLLAALAWANFHDGGER